jgi:transposase-like protein
MGKRGPKPRFVDMSCPNEQCALYGIAGKGNVIGHGTYETQSGKVRKYICHSCGKMFCDRTNTAFYDLRTSNDKVVQALEMSISGMSLRKIGGILKVKPSTVGKWISRAAEHSQKVDEVVMKDVVTERVEMDELWTFVEKKHCPKMVNSKMKGPGSG